MPKIHLTPTSSSINYYGDSGSGGGSGLEHFWYAEDCKKIVDGESVQAAYIGHLFKTKPTPTFGGGFDIVDYDGQPGGVGLEVTWSGEIVSREEARNIVKNGGTFGLTKISAILYGDADILVTNSVMHIISGFINSGTAHAPDYYTYTDTAWNYRDNTGNVEVHALLCADIGTGDDYWDLLT